jgi:hypothetical protein
VTVVPVAQPESAKPAATAATTLNTDGFKARSLSAWVRMPPPNSLVGSRREQRRW